MKLVVANSTCSKIIGNKGEVRWVGLMISSGNGLILMGLIIGGNKRRKQGTITFHMEQIARMISKSLVSVMMVPVWFNEFELKGVEN